MFRSIVSWGIALGFACVIAPQAWSAEEKAASPAKPETIEMNFHNVEIGNFLSIMSRAFDIPFVWDATTVRGEITLESYKKYSREDAFKLFQTVLSMRGFTIIQSEGSPIVRVVPVAEAARMATPINPEPSTTLGGNVFITRIISLQFADASALQAALTPLITKGAAIAAYPAANALIITDTEENLRRLQKLIVAMDIETGPGDIVVIQLKYASAKKLAPLFSALTAEVPAGGKAVRGRAAPQGGPARKPVIIAEERTNSLIVSADPADIAQLKTLIEVLDVPGKFENAGFKIYRLKYAQATNMVQILRQISHGTGGAAPAVRARPEQPAAAPEGAQEVVIAADAPTNALIVFAPPEVIETFDQLVAVLDVPGRAEENYFKIYHLKYAAADELATLLQNVKTIATRAARTDRGETQPPAQPQPMAPGQAAPEVVVAADKPTNSLIIFGAPEVLGIMDQLVAALDIPGRIQPSTFKLYRLEHASAADLAAVLKEVKESAEKAATTTTPEAGAPQPRRPATTTGQAPPGLTISADKATNTLIVFGTNEMIATMDKIIAQLDVRRPQVYVEALIMEVTLEKSLQLGINWQGAGKVGNSVIGGGFPNAQPKTLEDTLASGSGAVLGIIGDQIEFQGQKFTSFSAFIQATRQDQDLNILANPQILTLDNQEAEINVSQVIPVSAKVVRDAQLQTTTEFEFKDVGIILKITPQITGTDKVLLTINQESSSVAAKQVTTGADQSAITTLKRTINSKVLIDNKATMAIGGLIQDQEVQTVTKVPCLGDVPVLGWFFKSRDEQLRKTNLVVFLRPHIINSREDLAEVTQGVHNRFESANNPKVDAEGRIRQDFELPPKGQYTPGEEKPGSSEERPGAAQ